MEIFSIRPGAIAGEYFIGSPLHLIGSSGDTRVRDLNRVSTRSALGTFQTRWRGVRFDDRTNAGRRNRRTRVRAVRTTGGGRCGGRHRAVVLQARAPSGGLHRIGPNCAAFPGREVALLWEETCGWALAVETRSGEDLIVLGYLGEHAVPTPDAVADFAATLGTRSPHWVMNRPLADSDETARELRSYSGSAYA
ncbi:DUF6292 family protein [Rhodococcus sp. 3Y1]